MGQTANLKAGAPYPLGAPGDFTCGGNAAQAKCMFPFEYAGKTHHTCTHDGHTQDWCVAGVGGTTGLRFGNCACSGGAVMDGHMYVCVHAWMDARGGCMYV